MEEKWSMALDSQLWKNIIICLKAVAPLMGVLCLVDSDEKPAIGFIYEEMNFAKEKITSNFNNVQKSYEPIWKIIDERWDSQLPKPLHAAAYYLNPHFHYEPNFRDDVEVEQGLYNSMSARKIMIAAEWWEFNGDECPELKRFAIRTLSLTRSSSGYERNWSSFEMVHSKRRNCLHQKMMNDLVYVMYNSKLKSQQIRRNLVVPFDDIHSDNEWITKEDVSNVNGENVIPSGWQ